MPLSEEAAVSRANDLLKVQHTVRGKLDPVRRYWKGRQRLPAIIPGSAPSEVREMARISRVNVCEIVVESLKQSLILEGIRAEREDDDGDTIDAMVDPVWRVLQENRWDKRQAGVHAGAVAYGRAYAVGLRERGRPVVRGVSPRGMTAMYGDDPDWPVDALERGRNGRFILYDNEATYRLQLGTGNRLEMRANGIDLHGLGRTPVVRYDAEDDLDEEDEPEAEISGGRLSSPPPVEIVTGQVAGLTNLQDQIDVITFNLMVAQHYTAFRQRYVIGWSSADEKEAMKFAASTLWAFKDNPEDIRVGEFAETDLSGYISSREHALKYGATLSQTPVHELIGQMINLAAEALAAAEAGRDRKVDMFKLSLGESHEQLSDLIGTAVGADMPDDVQIVWKDTSARAFSAVVQGLGLLATQLGMPPQELWDRVPGFTQQDIRRMKAVAAEGDSLANLMTMLDRQANDNGNEQQTGSGLILPPGVAA